MAFSDFQKLQKKTKEKFKLKDSNDNIIGIIDESNNLIIINPDYKLQVSNTIQSTTNQLNLLTKDNTGIKIDKNIKFITPEGEKTIGQTHTHDYKDLNGLPTIQIYTDQQAREACDDQINAKDARTLNGYSINDIQRKLEQQLEKLPIQEHTHDVNHIKNLPVSIKKEEVQHLIKEAQNQLSTKLVEYYNTYLFEVLNEKSDIDHTHELNTYSKEDIDNLLTTKSNVDHTHNFPKYTDQQVINIINSQNLVSKNNLDSLLSNKANKSHIHTEEDLRINKYKKSEVDSLLKKKSDIDHKHELKEIAKPGDLYTNQDANKLIQSYLDKEIILEKNKILNLLNDKAPTDHGHEFDLDVIFDELKEKLKKYLENNITAYNSHNLNGLSSNQFSKVDHSHSFKDLIDKSHKHKEVDLEINKFTKEEVNKFLDNKANKSHKHHVNDILNFPKLYQDKDTNIFVQNNLIDDTVSASNKLYSSSKIEAMVNNRARIDHKHTINEVAEIKGYIERTVETTVKTNIKNHKHSMFDITDKPTFYNDSQARNAIGGQVNDRGDTNTDIWSAKKIQSELEYLKNLIDSKL